MIETGFLSIVSSQYFCCTIKELFPKDMENRLHLRIVSSLLYRNTELSVISLLSVLQSYWSPWVSIQPMSFWPRGLERLWDWTHALYEIRQAANCTWHKLLVLLASWFGHHCGCLFSLEFNPSVETIRHNYFLLLIKFLELNFLLIKFGFCLIHSVHWLSM